MRVSAAASSAGSGNLFMPVIFFLISPVFIVFSVFSFSFSGFLDFPIFCDVSLSPRV